MVHCAHDAIFAVGLDLTVLSWNPAAEVLFGYPTAEIVGHNVDLLIPLERRADLREMVELIDAGARMERFRAERQHRDGHLVPVMVTMSPLRDPSDALIGLTVIARAVSDRERLESSLQSLLEAAPDAFVGVADDGRVVLSNGQAEILFGLARHGLIGKPIDKLLVPPLPANPIEPHSLATLSSPAAPAKPPGGSSPATSADSNTTAAPANSPSSNAPTKPTNTPDSNAPTDPANAHGGNSAAAPAYASNSNAATDPTNAHRGNAPTDPTDAHGGNSAAAYASGSNAAADPANAHRRNVPASPADNAAAPTNRSGSNTPVVPAETRTNIPGGNDADADDEVDSESDGDLRKSASVAHRADGSTVPVEVSVSILVTDEGRIRCAVIRDISDRVRAQDRFLQLQAEAERAHVEAQLQRTQRLEGLGQLAGGVAHDFNNLIAVISNYATFIAEATTDLGLVDIAGDAAQITKAAQRGAELTHQLLAFARREVVRPRPLNLNDVVADIEQMLRRSIGEHIALIVRLTNDLPAITADPGQLDQVLVNLAVNARDAMPRGGNLSIETCCIDVDGEYAGTRPHLHPGRYVRLRVSDTGTGMPPEVIERAFEPFYTTKPAGKGTGLGLATVYGIVTAAGGDLNVYSEPGMGTTFTILLPITDAQPTEAEPAAEAAPASYLRATVLAVEDEPALRDVLQRILISAGHDVLIAADGPAALALAAAHNGPVDVLLTDVVMPHMLGKDLADHFTTVRPGTRVLFMSGYARPVLASQGTLDPDVTLVEKPFTKSQLLDAVQQCLDRRPAPTPRPAES